MAQDPFEHAGRAFRRAVEGHARHLEEALAEVHAALERVRVDIWRTRRFSDDPWLHSFGQGGTPPRKRRRPPRKGPDVEPAPVKPRPNPTPLQRGAEAPIE